MTVSVAGLLLNLTFIFVLLLTGCLPVSRRSEPFGQHGNANSPSTVPVAAQAVDELALEEEAASAAKTGETNTQDAGDPNTTEASPDEEAAETEEAHETTEDAPSDPLAEQFGLPSADEIDGAEVYKNAGCSSCHGADLSGRKMGPPLTGIAPYWTVDEMVRWLKDPSSAYGKDRLVEIGREYGIVMPPANRLTETELEALARWLMKQ